MAEEEEGTGMERGWKKRMDGRQALDWLFEEKSVFY